MSRIHIEGGRVVDPRNKLDAELALFIEDGIIASIGDRPNGFKADRVIDARGQIVCPGLVDLCARLREPGAEHKATIASEAVAAARAGITLLCTPPDTEPVIDEPAVVDLIQHRAREAGGARVATLGALTAKLEGQQLSEMAALKAAGCVGVSNALKPLPDTRVLRQAMEYAATHELTIHAVPLDESLSKQGVAHKGTVSTLLGLQGMPVSAETVAIARHLALIEEVGVRVHFGRLSSARSVQMIEAAKRRGLPVTADVAVHHLHLTDEAILQFDSRAHVRPPLRSAADRDALLEGLKTGVIDAICSDHQPHEPDAKLNPFPSTEPGISGLDTLLGLSLALLDKADLPLHRIIGALTGAPARILGADGGRLAVGAPADLCVFDPYGIREILPETLNSAGKNTPFIGAELPGLIKHTLIAGRVLD